jgi:hypothetical protein
MNVLIQGFFDCYTFDKMFPFQDFERYPIKSGSWSDGLGGVLLKNVSKEDIKNITEHIMLNGYNKNEIRVLKLTEVKF